VPESRTATSRSPDSVDLGLQPKYVRTICDAGHGFNGVHYQVQQHLLQLNAISQHRRETLRQLQLEQHSILRKLRRARASTSWITSFISSSLFSAGAFFMNPRIRAITELARVPSRDDFFKGPDAELQDRDYNGRVISSMR